MYIDRQMYIDFLFLADARPACPQAVQILLSKKAGAGGTAENNMLKTVTCTSYSASEWREEARAVQGEGIRPRNAASGRINFKRKPDEVE